MTTQPSLDLGWATADLTGFDLKRTPNVMEWGAAWLRVDAEHKLTKWVRGWLYMLKQEGVVGEEAEQWIRARDVTLGTIQNEASVVRAYQGQYGFIGKVSFGHHDVVAKLEPSRRRHWLQLVYESDLTVKELREMTAEERGIAGEKDAAKLGLERMLAWRDKMEKEYYDLPEGPWGEEVEESLRHLERAIEIYRDNLKPLKGTRHAA